MKIGSIRLFIVAVAVCATSGQTADNESDRYGVSVSYEDGKCIYWTGDVGFDAKGFRGDLMDRFDRKMGITIFREASVHKKCEKRARQLIKQAGFNDIDVRIGRIDLSPSMGASTKQ